MKLKYNGYTYDCNQTTAKKIIKENLNFMNIYKYQHNNRDKITIYERDYIGNRYIYYKEIEITNCNYNQLYNICSFLETKNIKQTTTDTRYEGRDTTTNNRKHRNNNNNNNNNNNKSSICNTITIIILSIIMMIILLRII
jgi:ATP-dependent Zn protease